MQVRFKGYGRGYGYGPRRHERGVLIGRATYAERLPLVWFASGDLCFCRPHEIEPVDRPRVEIVASEADVAAVLRQRGILRAEIGPA